MGGESHPGGGPDQRDWHRLIGGLIEALDRPIFWNVLVRYLHDLVAYDTWVVLRFARDKKPVVYAESPVPGGGTDELFQDYLNGFYLLDPFYIDCIENPKPGLLRLDDVAPDHFEAEDYYQRYFRLNVTTDEVHFNLPMASGDVLILSFGSKHRYTPDEMRVFAMIQPWVLALMRQRIEHDEPYENGAAAEKLADNPLPESISSAGVGTGRLTSRELEIVHLLLSGFSSKRIAQKLKISPETVKGHRKHIYIKLGVKTHAELFAIYLQAKTPRSAPGAGSAVGAEAVVAG